MTQAPVGPPPTREIGHAGNYLPPWNYFGAVSGGSDPDEPADLRWPMCLRTYNKMRTDAQVDGLIRSVTVPVRKLRWQIDPNGARDEVVQDIATQLNLPIRGSSQNIQRGRKRFSHDDHLRMALLAPTVFGHMPFEIVGGYPDNLTGLDLQWKLRKLAPRMPQSLAKIDVARDGGLVSITQYDSSTSVPPPIPVQDLAFYSWEKEGSNWTGRSMLRPLYKHWIAKDRLMRIDLIKNERFGAGIPTATAPPGGDPADYSKMAQAARASEYGGQGLPNGAQFAVQGVSGTLPDTIASMRYHDEMMAGSFLAMFKQLGQSHTGSRALGETFVDFFIAGLATFANWYQDITNEHVIEDIVDWNYGVDEQAPLLVWDEEENEPLGVSELARLIMAGALVVDADMENWIRERYAMPEYTGGEPLPTKPGTGAQDKSKPVDPNAPAPATSSPSDATSTPAPATSSGNPANASSSALRAHGDHDQLSHGHRHVHAPDEQAHPFTIPAAAPSGVQVDKTRDRRSKTKFLGRFGGRNKYMQVEVDAAGQTLTSKKPEIGHREPNAIEASAGTDFKKLQEQWATQTTSLVDAWGTVRDGQIDDLVTQIEAAVEANSPEALAAIRAQTTGADVIMKHMLAAGKQAAAGAVAEGAKQGVKLITPTDAALTASLQPRANAMAALMSRGLSDSAARTSLLQYGVSSLSAKDVGAGVRDHLNNLSDSYLNDQLGGALTQAQNSSRIDVMTQADASATTYYASELLDTSTCDNCAQEDEKQFGSVDDATTDYPSGGYVDCLGGARCRGTIVAVYGEGDNPDQ